MQIGICLLFLLGKRNFGHKDEKKKQEESGKWAALL